MRRIPHRLANALPKKNPAEAGFFKLDQTPNYGPPTGADGQAVNALTPLGTTQREPL